MPGDSQPGPVHFSVTDVRPQQANGLCWPHTGHGATRAIVVADHWCIVLMEIRGTHGQPNEVTGFDVVVAGPFEFRDLLDVVTEQCFPVERRVFRDSNHVILCHRCALLLVWLLPTEVFSLDSQPFLASLPAPFLYWRPFLSHSRPHV